MTARFRELARRRRMTRHFLPDPIDDALLRGLLDTARRVPSAGNAQGFDFVVLRGAQETARYWEVTLPPERRGAFRWASLWSCPVLVTVWADPQAYLERYAEPDKARSGLGAGVGAWPTPYWTVDAAFAALALQYAAIDEGLGVLFFGMFGHADAVAAALGVPSAHEPIGALALGWPDLDAEAADDPAASRDRARRSLCGGPADDATDDAVPTTSAARRRVVHWGRWMGA
ncbi:nitroreductase family protein [Candidatus Poriferisodalis sp.]|uniref:nitroreductase family protein n=1 Tax=Candidatus Poriferisodalis sp. TaxID=3101277 RepID=UPI003B011057